MNKKILVLENVSVYLSSKKSYVFKDLSFELSSGETLSIIGLNGSGKTTLLKCIAGIKKITSGNIIKNFNNLYYIPQKLELDSTFPITVLEFIKIYNQNISDEEITSYLKKFSIDGFLERKISSLSGGEMQKVLIISGIISKPDLLLLDEPTAAIDSAGEKLFYSTINDVKKLYPNISIILVSHNISLVYKNSDKILCLHENNLCCHGTPSDLIHNEKIANIFGEHTAQYEHNPHKKKIKEH